MKKQSSEKGKMRKKIHEIEENQDKILKRVKKLHDELIETIRPEVVSVFRKKIKGKISREVESNLEEAKAKLKSEITGLLENGYFNRLDNLANQLISSKIKNKKFYETYVMKGGKISLKRIMKKYDEGWRIAYHGILKDGEPQIIIMDRPKSIKEKDK